MASNTANTTERDLIKRSTSRRWMMAWAAATAAMFGIWIGSGLGVAQTPPSVNLTVVGEGQTSVSPKLPLTSYADSKAFLELPATVAAAVEWPGATSLTAKSLGNAEVTFDDGNQTIVFETSAVVPFGSDSFDTITVVDYDKAGQPPTIAMGLDGDFSIVASGKTIKVTGQLSLGTDKLEITTEAGALVVPDSVNQFFGGDASAVPDGVGFFGDVTLSDVIGDLAENQSATLSVSGAIETSVADLLNDGAVDTNTSFEFAGSISSGGLFLPDSLQASAFNLNVSYDKESDELAASAGGSIVIRDNRVGPGNLTFTVEAGFAYSTDSVAVVMAGSYSGTEPWNPLGFDGVEATDIKFKIDLSTTESAVTLSANLAIGANAATAVPVGFSVEVIGRTAPEPDESASEINVEITMGEITLGQMLDVLSDRFPAATIPELGSEAREAGLTSFVAELSIIDGAFTIYAEAGVRLLEGRNVDVALLMNDDEIILALKLPTGLKLGDVTSAPLGDTFQDITLPSGSVVVRSPGSNLAVEDLDSEQARNFLAPLYGCDDPDSCDSLIIPGVQLVAEITLAPYNDALAELWIAPNSSLRVTGTLPLFDGRAPRDPDGNGATSDPVEYTPFNLTVDLPTIAPPLDGNGRSVAPWLKSGDISLSITQDRANLKVAATGTLVALLDDETEPLVNGRRADEVTFEVGIEIEAAAKGTELTIFGSVSNWETPLGEQWLDLNNVTLEATVSVGANTAFQVGLRADLRLGTTNVDVSFALSVRPAPTPIGIAIDIGVRVYVDTLSARDLLRLAESATGLGLGSNQAPDITLRNLEVSFAGPTISSERLCLEPGFKIGAEIHLNESAATSATRDDQRETDSCKARAVTEAEGVALCTGSCVGYGRFEINDDGLTAQAGLNTLTFGNGAVTIHDARLDVRATTTEQSFAIAGGIEVAGFVRASGEAQLNSDGISFRVEVSDAGSGPNPTESFSIAAALQWGPGSPGFALEISVVSEAFANFTEGVTQTWSNAREFFGAEPSDVVRVECFTFGISAFSGTGSPLGDDRTTNGIVGEVRWTVYPADPTKAPTPKLARLEWDFDASLASNLSGLGDLTAELDTAPCGNRPEFVKFGGTSVALNDYIAANGPHPGCSGSQPNPLGSPYPQAVFGLTIPCVASYDALTGVSFRDDFVTEGGSGSFIDTSAVDLRATTTLVYDTPGLGSYIIEYDQMNDPQLDQPGHEPNLTKLKLFTADGAIVIDRPAVPLTAHRLGADRIRVRLLVPGQNGNPPELIVEKFFPIFFYSGSVSERRTDIENPVREGDTFPTHQYFTLAPQLDPAAFRIEPVVTPSNTLRDEGFQPASVDRVTGEALDTRVWRALDNAPPGPLTTVRGRLGFLLPVFPSFQVVDEGFGDESVVPIANRPPYIEFVAFGGAEASSSFNDDDRNDPYFDFDPAYTATFDDLSPVVFEPDGTRENPSVQTIVIFDDPGENDGPFDVVIRTSDGSVTEQTFPDFGFKVIDHVFDSWPDSQVEMQITVTDKDGGVSQEFSRSMTLVGSNDFVEFATPLVASTRDGEVVWRASGSTLDATHQGWEIDGGNNECGVWFSFDLPPVIRPGANARTSRFDVRAVGTTANSWEPIELNVYIPPVRSRPGDSPNQDVRSLVGISSRNGSIGGSDDPIYQFISTSDSAGEIAYLVVYTADGCNDGGAQSGPFELEISVATPENDGSKNSPDITPSPTATISNHTNLYATDELGEPQLRNQEQNGSVWYTLTSPYRHAEFTVETLNDTPSDNHLDSVVAVYAAANDPSFRPTDFDQLVLAGTNDDGGSNPSCGLCSSVTFDRRSFNDLPLTDTWGDEEPEFWIQVGGYTFSDRPDRGTFDLRVTAHSNPTPPAELGSTPRLRFDPETKSYSELGANVGPVDREFEFVAPQTGVISVGGTGSGFSAVELLDFATGQVVDTTDTVDCVDQCFAVRSGVRYSISWSGADGDYEFGTAYLAFGNDDIIRANVLAERNVTPLATGATNRGNAQLVASGEITGLATRDEGEPFHAGITSTDHTVWFTVDVTKDHTVTIETSDADFDTVLAIYRGSDVTDLTEIASNDDVAEGNLNSKVTFTASQTETLLVAVSGYGESFGSSSIEMTSTAPPEPPEPPVDPPVNPPVDPPVNPPVNPPVDPPTTTPPAFSPLSPSRFADTRANGETIDDLFRGDGAVSGGSFYEIQIAGRGDVPDTASAAALNITSVRSDANGFLTVYPCGDRPNASSVNYERRANTPNEVIAKLSATGTVCVFSSSTTELLVDVVAYSTTGSAYTPLTPARIADTRPGAGETVDDLFAGDDVIAAGEFYEVQVSGRGGVSPTARTATLNITSVGPQGGGFLTVWPCGPRPNASALNYQARANTANEIITKLSSSGSVCVFSSQSTNLLIDVVGQLDGEGTFTSVSPARLADTRSGSGETVDGRFAQRGVISGGDFYEVQITGRGNVAPDATTAVINVTSVGPATGGFFTVWPCDTQPNASALNFAANQNRANEIIAKLSPTGSVCVFTNTDANLLIDVVGFAI